MINAGHGVFSGSDKRLRGETDDAQEDTIARISVPASGSRVRDFVKHTNTILIGEILNCVLKEREKKGRKRKARRKRERRRQEPGQVGRKEREGERERSF